MFAKLFQKPNQVQQSPSSEVDMAHESTTSSELAPFVAVHYGIPSTASILAFDPIQGLLAVGTLDGRIKVVGGGNIEGLLVSPNALPFRNLEFLQNQGFLVSVSNENEIQVWDLEKRRIASNIKWESNITAFSVISGTNYMYLGDEYGFLSVLKYDAEEDNILQLPYYVPLNLIAEGAGISLPDHQSIVGVLSQPCSCGNRVLIAYGNGLIILWDVAEDRAVHVKGNGVKGGTVVNFSSNESHTYQTDSLDNEEAEKEISSLCWVSTDGSVLAVGYVDGDVLLWYLSASEHGKGQETQKSTNDVVKIQLSSGDRRLPVIVLHWSSNKAQNGRGGQLFVYGGVDIGAEEVLTILELDWSHGLAKLKCVERVDLTLHGSYADLNVISNGYKVDNSNGTALFVLTNPGQLHFYQFDSLSTLKSERGKNHSVHAMQYHSVIPTMEPCMTVGELYVMSSERNIFSSLSKTVTPAKQRAHDTTDGSKKWPLTGGVPCQKSTTEPHTIERIYVGGYQDGTVRIWDATFSVLSLVSVLGFEIKDIEVAGASAPISAVDLCFRNLTLAIGNEVGVIFLYRLQGNSNHATVTIVTETKHEVHHYRSEERNNCSIIYLTLSSPVRALKFTTSGAKLVVGFECGQVAVLNTRSASVLFVTDSVSSSKSPVISVAVKTCLDTHQSGEEKSDSGTESESAPELVFVLTRDAHMVLVDCPSGNIISSQPMYPEEKSTAISMHLLDDGHRLVEGSKSVQVTSSQHTEAQSQPSQSGSSNFKARESPNLEHKMLESHILLCSEEAIYVYPLESVIQGVNNFIHKLKLEKPCSWTAICKRDDEKCGLLLVYQNGEIEIRSLPELKLLGHTSMTSVLRWNFKNNMDKTLSASEKGQITLVNGNEFALVSLLAFEDELRSLPCLHDKVLAAVADADVNGFQIQKKAEGSLPGLVSNMLKGLKGVKDEQIMNYTEARETMILHLESIFSRFPFSDTYNAYDLEDLELQVDDINIDDPVPVAMSSQKNTDDIKGKETEREKLFEGGSTDLKPKVRTREEIIAKYRNTGDAAGAASQAKEKLMERKEKLEKLSQRTEELQSGAENFADMATELAKAMEKRKWWNI